MKQSILVLSMAMVLLLVFVSEFSCQLPMSPPPKCSEASSKEIDLYDCKRYWQCEYGKAANFECPGEKYFDHDTRVSD